MTMLSHNGEQVNRQTSINSFCNKSVLQTALKNPCSAGVGSESELGSGSLQDLFRVIGSWDLLHTGFHTPDFTSILSNGAITRELARCSDVVNHLLGPFLGFLFDEAD